MVKTLELDIIGQFYASRINREQCCVFAITVHLTNKIVPEVLQKATNDLVRRLPFMNGRLANGFLHFKNEFLSDPPIVIPEADEPLFCHFYCKGSRHMMRVAYGADSFTIKTSHVLTDGRGLEKIAAALVVRYYELLGVKINKDGVIDCLGDLDDEEMENAYLRYGSDRSRAGERPPKNVLAYRRKANKDGEQYTLTKFFSAKKIKVLAKILDLSITQYLLLKIFEIVKKERETANSKRPIAAFVPVDCRNFFRASL